MSERPDARLACTFPAVAGKAYRLQQSSQLPSQRWLTVTNLTAGPSDQLLEVLLPPPVGSAAWYRVIIPPAP
jgi:hypothetical protein